MFAQADSYSNAEVHDAQPTGAAAASAKQKVASRRIWLRFLYMALFAVVFWVMHAVLALVVVLQFLLVATTKKPNKRLVTFGHELGQYYYYIVLFLTFRTEELPFPFSNWHPADREQ